MANSDYALGARRDLRDDTDDAVLLKLVVNLKIFTTAWSLAYTLSVKAIEIERVDVVESRLSGVEVEVAQVALAVQRHSLVSGV